MKHLLTRRSRGAILVLNLVAIAVFAILGVVVYGVIRYQVRETVYQERQAQAHYIAEAGVEDALHMIYTDPVWKTGFSQKAFSGGYYTVVVSTDNPPLVEATGYSQSIGVFGRAFDTVSARAVIVYSTGPAPMPGYAIMGGTSWTVNETGIVDSYDPSVNLNPASFYANAALWSNRDVTVQSGGKVYGNVYYYNNKNIAAGTVSGTVVKSTYTQTLPSYICDAACQTAAIANNLTGITGPASCYDSKTKDLNVNGNGVICNLAPGTYYLHNINVKGGILNVNTTTGTVTIYFTGPLNTSGSTCQINNLSKIPSRLLLYGQAGGATDNLTCPGAPLHAYLVDTTCNYDINSTVYGRIIGDKVVIDKGGMLHADVAGSQGAVSHVDVSTGTWKKSKKKH